jgi:hypothetical protein
MKAAALQAPRRSVIGTSHVPDDPPAWARELIGEVRALRQAVERQTARYAPRDSADLAVLQSIVEVVGPKPFTSREIFAAAGVDPQLRQALEAADLDGPIHLGNLLSRLYKSGLVHRAAPSRDGARWIL